MKTNPMKSERDTSSNPAHKSCRATIPCLWLAGVVIALLAMAFFFSPTAFGEEEKKTDAGAPPKAPALPVEAVQVETTPVNRELTVVGSLLANESVVIAPEISGRVSEIAFQEGQPVAEGQVLLRLDPSVLEAERDRARASLVLSEANIKRADVLLQDQAIAVRERDEAFAQWRLDQANLRLTEAQLAKTELRSPFAGVLGLRQVSVGDYLQPGEPVASLEDIDPIKVDFRIPEVYAERVAVGQAIKIRVDAVPGRIFTGEVYAVDPKIDVNGRSMLLRARVPNTDGPLRPGMFARVNLILEERPNAVMIPEQALVAQGTQQMVYKVIDGKVQISSVEIGLRRAGQVEIVAGLDAGETVITAGQIKVRPGMEVTVLPAARTQSGG